MFFILKKGSEKSGTTVTGTSVRAYGEVDMIL